MKALRLHGKRDLRLHEESAPSPGDGELLLRVTAVGLCGSDRHWFVEGGIGDAALTRPLVLGHEFVGTVQSGPRAGSRVVVDPSNPCGRCVLCRSGETHLCPELQFAGHGLTDGGLRTLVTWPEALAYELPDGLGDAEGTLLEPLGVALHALDLGRVRPGATTAVFGCGPIGLLLLQLLRVFAATTTVAIDLLPHRRAAAAALGATDVLDTDGTLADPVLVDRLSGGYGVDVAFEVAGDDAALAGAIDAVRPGGRVVIVGIPDGDRTSLTASKVRRKGLTLLFCRRMKRTDLPRAMKLVDTGRIELGRLVSERYAFSDWQDAFADLVDRRGLKVIIEPQRVAERGT